MIYESNLHQHKQIDMLNMIQYKSNNATLKSSQTFKITFKLINTCCVIHKTRSDVTLKTILKAQFFNHIKSSDSAIKSLKVSFFYLYNHI